MKEIDWDEIKKVLDTDDVEILKGVDELLKNADKIQEYLDSLDCKKCKDV